MLPLQKIRIENEDEIALVLQGDALVSQRRRGEAILDVNQCKNWINGLEIIGGFVDFRLDKAVKAFDPVTPFSHSEHPAGVVTYENDEGVEMVFIYLHYDPRISTLPHEQRSKLLRSAGSIVNSHCSFGLNEDGELVEVRIPLADYDISAEDFIKLLKK